MRKLLKSKTFWYPHEKWRFYSVTCGIICIRNIEQQRTELSCGSSYKYIAQWEWITRTLYCWGRSVIVDKVNDVFTFIICRSHNSQNYFLIKLFDATRIHIKNRPERTLSQFIFFIQILITKTINRKVSLAKKHFYPLLRNQC